MEQQALKHLTFFSEDSRLTDLFAADVDEDGAPPREAELCIAVC